MLQTERINLKKVNSEARHRLARECYDKVFDRIWDGVGFDLFFELFFSRSDVENLYLFRTKDQKLAGYFSFRAMNIKLGKKNYAAVRLSTNILPKHQGQNLLHRLVFIESLKYFMKTLINRQSFMIFFTSNSPVSYCLFKRRTRKTYPCPKEPTPKAVQEVMLLACDQFKVPLINRELFVSSYSVRLRPEATPLMRQIAHEDEFYRFYMERCPRYSEGQALVTMKPVTILDSIIDISQQVYRLSVKKYAIPFRALLTKPLFKRT